MWKRPVAASITTLPSIGITCPVTGCTQQFSGTAWACPGTRISVPRLGAISDVALSLASRPEISISCPTPSTIAWSFTGFRAPSRSTAPLPTVTVGRASRRRLVSDFIWVRRECSCGSAPRSALPASAPATASLRAAILASIIAPCSRRARAAPSHAECWVLSTGTAPAPTSFLRRSSRSTSRCRLSARRIASVEKPDWLFLSTSARSVTVSRVTLS
mmetsp:Transcript_33049/g.78302  ORF Transcript_33049/g.78302 Transcript_33049/m.78302 type:complete len:217 (-) Transcript_33049:1049-1699(-)